MDVFQNLLLTKRITQEDELSDILFKRTLHQVCYRPTRVNQEALINLGTQDGASKAIFIYENTSLLAEFFNASFSNETANAFRHRLRFL